MNQIYVCHLNILKKSAIGNPNPFLKTLISLESVSEYNHIHSIKYSSKLRRLRARALILVNGHGSWTQESAAMYEWNSKYNWQKGRRGQASRAFSQTRPAETGGMRCKTGMEREYRIEVITSLSFQDKRDLSFFTSFVILSVPSIEPHSINLGLISNQATFQTRLFPLTARERGDKKKVKLRKSSPKKLTKRKKYLLNPEDLKLFCNSAIFYYYRIKDDYKKGKLKI